MCVLYWRLRRLDETHISAEGAYYVCYSSNTREACVMYRRLRRLDETRNACLMMTEERTGGREAASSMNF